MLRPLFDRLIVMPKTLLTSSRDTSTGAGTGGPARFARKQESRKSYGVLRDERQIELVTPRTRTGEGSRALISANVAPRVELDGELGIGGVEDGGGERYAHVEVLDTGIHVQRSITVER